MPLIFIGGCDCQEEIVQSKGACSNCHVYQLNFTKLASLHDSPATSMILFWLGLWGGRISQFLPASSVGFSPDPAGLVPWANPSVVLSNCSARLLSAPAAALYRRQCNQCCYHTCFPPRAFFGFFLTYWSGISSFSHLYFPHLWCLACR